MNQPKHIDLELLAQLWPTNLTTKEIADRLGCTAAHVSHVAIANGLPRRAINVGMLPQKRIVAAYVEHKLSLEKIAAQLRKSGFPTVSASTVGQVLRMRGVKLRPRNSRPAMSRASECLQLLRAGLNRGQIAEKLGMHIGQVNRRLARLIGVGRRGQVGMHTRSA